MATMNFSVDFYTNSDYKGLVNGGEAKSKSGMDSDNVDWGYQVFNIEPFRTISLHTVINSVKMTFDYKSNRTTTTVRCWTRLYNVRTNGRTNPVSVTSAVDIGGKESGDFERNKTSYTSGSATWTINKTLSQFSKSGDYLYFATRFYADRSQGVLKPTLYIRNLTLTIDYTEKAKFTFYNYDGSTASSIIYNRYDTVTVPTPKSPGNNYIFLGWSKTAGGAVVIVSKAADSFDQNYYAVWQKNEEPKCFVGENPIKEAYIGTSKVKEIYIGTNKVF